MSKPTPEQPRPPAVRGSLRWLVEQYYQSAEFKRLVRGHVRRSILDEITKEHGAKP